MSRFSRFSKSNNPVMKDELFQRTAAESVDGDMIAVRGERMTVQGAINKSFILFALMMLTALISYAMPSQLFLWGGAIGGLVVVIIASMKPHLSGKLAPAYALLEGLFVGTITWYYGSMFSGIIFQAVMLTAALLFTMLFIYKSGIIKVTNKFRTGVIMATGAIFLVYIVNIVLSFFGMSVPYLHEGGTIGILISLGIIAVASLNLLLDFDNFEKGEKYGSPTYMEWFCGMGLLITLVWIYIEVLRLLAIFASNE